MNRLWFVLMVISMIVGIAGCGSNGHGSSSSSSGPIDVTGSFQSIQAGTALVVLTANVKVNWTLSLANVPCTPGCGTLTPTNMSSLTAVYTPPALPPLNASATITASSAKDASQSFVFDFTITPPIMVSITNKFTTQLASGPPIVVNASVSNDAADAGVNWTLTAGGTACSPACGTLVASAAPSFTAAYTPPPTVPSGADDMPTITATTVTNSSVSDSFSFTINSAAGLLSGNFTFLLRGYDGNGLPMSMAGAMTADGMGNITGGEFDINDDGGITQVPAPAAGNYSIDTSFNGVTRGTITITSFTFPGSSDDIVLKFALSADGTRGKIVELDGSGFLNAGTILLQDPNALSSGSAAGTYAFGLDSDAPVGGRVAETGQFILGAGGITGGLVDQSQAGGTMPIYSASPVTSGPATSPDPSGRGTLTLTVAGNATNYAYYVVNSGQINLIEIDGGLLFGTVQAGTAFVQGALSAASVNTTSVLQLTGMDVFPGTNTIGPDAIIGVMTISGASFFNLTFDENDIGNILTDHLANGSLASFDPASGRGVLSASDGFNSGFVNSATFYLYGAGQGFIIDTDPSTSNAPPDQAVTNNAFSGTLTPQMSGPFSSQSLSGNSVALLGASAISDLPNMAAGANFDDTAGAFTGEGDLTSLNSEGANIPDFTFNGTYSVVDTVLGRGTATLPSPLFGNFSNQQIYPVSFYLIGPNRFVLIGIENGAESGVVFFDPQ